ncbi:MAG TPA: copper transporter [Mycobacteriales bacterium]|nr:copper transporter [Mycobacteriales bacterium]
MIDFRYHIVSLVAVFLALALGLFLGSTTLQSTVTHNLRQQADSVIARNHTLQSANDQANAELKQAQDFETSVEPYAVAGKLVGADVAVVSAPGVDSGARNALTSTLRSAGAVVTADIRLADGFTDPQQDATWGQLALQLAGTRSLPHANGASQAGGELARVLLTRPGVRLASPRRTETVLSTLTDGKMISISGQMPVRAADVAVLLVPLGGNPESSSVATTRDNDLIALARSLRHWSSGLVVAGPTVSADPSSGGPLAAMRADSGLMKSVSTVDSDDTAIGRVATVLALAAAPGGAIGTYGESQSPPLPSQSPAP